ncbi:hypothetical protein [Haladaptatus sp. W1]|uniref:DUF7344 domain-containing protein n=1 Tax=Haladaptatus sp. W1 TaxID=1897478 RepID=UPI0015860E38|nr:hypothetical protein [Haladaptatus sp. W1]
MSDELSQPSVNTRDREYGLATLDESDRHRLLVSERRRVLLEALSDYTPPVDLEEMARAVAAREDSLYQDKHENVDEVSITLHHIHLPMMADFGVLDYDPDSNRIKTW